MVSISETRNFEAFLGWGAGVWFHFVTPGSLDVRKGHCSGEGHCDGRAWSHGGGSASPAPLTCWVGFQAVGDEDVGCVDWAAAVCHWVVCSLLGGCCLPLLSPCAAWEVWCEVVHLALCHSTDVRQCLSRVWEGSTSPPPPPVLAPP